MNQDTPLSQRQASVRDGIDNCRGPETTRYTVTLEAMERSFNRAMDPTDSRSYGDHLQLHFRQDNQEAQRCGYASYREMLEADPDYRQCQTEYEQDGREWQQAQDRGEEYRPSWADYDQRDEVDSA